MTKGHETFSSHTRAVSKHRATALQVQQACENVRTAVISLLQPCEVAGLMTNHGKSLLIRPKWKNCVGLCNNNIQGNTQVMTHAVVKGLISTIWGSLTCAWSIVRELFRTLSRNKTQPLRWEKQICTRISAYVNEPLMLLINLQSSCAFAIVSHKPLIALAS